jgi:hypothetical protein
LLFVCNLKKFKKKFVKFKFTLLFLYIIRFLHDFLILKKDLEEMNQIKYNSKLSACMALARNSLAEENQTIKQVIASSNFDKSKTYDKIVAMMLSNCLGKITDAQMEAV